MKCLLFFFDGKSVKGSQESVGLFGEIPITLQPYNRNMMTTMKKTILLLATMVLSAVPSIAWQGEVKVETPNMLMLLTAQEGQDLHLAYFGTRMTTLQEVRDAGDDVNFPALPAFGPQ